MIARSARAGLLGAAAFVGLIGVAFCVQARSVCHGTPARGSLEHGVPLPRSGANFAAYSAFGTSLGRTYVHDQVRDVVVDAYASLRRSAPGKVFVYGETGLRNGGAFPPHKTHQNGLSVDFFVPVLDARGVSVRLPSKPDNRFGYDIEFDHAGRYREYRIDFEAMALHLQSLEQAAARRDVGLRVVIFDNTLQRKLFESMHGRDLRSQIAFSTRKPWVRHDEHYHVDFVVRCR